MNQILEIAKWITEHISIYYWYLSIFLLFTFSIWTKFYKKKDNIAFDIAFWGGLIMLLLNRMLYVLLNWESTFTFWSSRMVVWIGGQRIIFGAMPWSLLAFWRNEIDPWILGISLAISILIINVFLKNKLLLTVNTVLSGIFFVVPIFLIKGYLYSESMGVVYDGFGKILYPNDQAWRFPLQIAFLIFFVIVAVVVNLLLRRKYKKFLKGDGYIKMGIYISLSPIIDSFFKDNSNIWSNFLMILLGIGFLIIGRILLNPKKVKSAPARVMRLPSDRKVNRMYSKRGLNFILSNNGHKRKITEKQS